MMGDAVATGTESSRGTEAPDEVTNSNQPVLAGLTTIPEVSQLFVTSGSLLTFRVCGIGD